MIKLNAIAKGVLITAFCSAAVISTAQTREVRINGATVAGKSSLTGLPNFIRFNPGNEITESQVKEWLPYAFNTDPSMSFKPYGTENDKLGFTHTRYKQYFNNFPVNGMNIITHSKNGKIVSVNGDFIQELKSSAVASLTEEQALQKALKKINAVRYKWENKEHESSLKEVFKNPDFSFYPKGELTVVHKKDAPFTSGNFHLAYKFNIYAEVPLYRANVFVDANTGEILDEQNLICTADVVGTGNTKYSGNVPMTSDNYATNQYRLRETGRGLGIQTYNLNNSTSYTNTDFTNNSSTWNLAGNDKAASDAHWGAEKTYDYYMQNHSRNSIDGNGYALLSYVHYSNNFVNAFWDGTEMTYGDGDVSQGFTIMTALDVCGHEITHGLTSYTGDLSGTTEGGALNEGFSDIFGTTIEFFARPAQNDWLMGADITPGGIRDMSNPNAIQQPDTYQGTYWDAGGEVHTNDGPCIYWYYLMCQGGVGTNDNGQAYNVTAIGMTDAAKIAFRALTVYFGANTQYSDARTAAIQAAADLFGTCSQQYKTCTNAWYAVGVGAQYSPTGVSAAFTADNLSSCVLPTTVDFKNNTSAGLSYVWYFGDGGISSQQDPTHVYTTAGTYNVKLVAQGCSAGSDSIIKNSYITINPPTAPNGTGAAVCTSGSMNLSASATGTLNWYDAPASGNLVHTGSPYTTPTLTTTTTYYVSNTVTQTPVIGAPALNTTLGTGGYLAYSHYLIFDANAGLTIQTVDVYANSTGTRTIELQDNAGVIISTANINLTVTGKTTVTLNFHVNPGTGYRLAVTSATIDLYRNNAGANFPYNIGTLVSITGTDVTSTNPNYYYWFYNWKVVKDPCVSSLTPVTATVNNCLGIESYDQENLMVYPNPANNELTIKSADGTVSVKLFDQLGKEILSLTQAQGTDNLKIDLSQLTEGIYYVSIRDKNKVSGRKIVVQH